MDKYTWDALDYEKSSSVQQMWARELIAKLDLKGDERVLDIGCGDGKITAEIAAKLKNGTVVGIDSSYEMIQLAQARHAKGDLANILFSEHDARRLPFHNEFDVVFSNAALHWVKDHLSVLQGIARSLCRGGIMLLQMGGGKYNAVDLVKAFDQLIEIPLWRDYFNDFTFPYYFYGPDDYYPLLSEVGFIVKRIELIPKDMVHDIPGFKSWVQTTWLPYTQRVPESVREQFLQQVIDEYLNRHPPDDEGMTHLGMLRLEIEASKP